MKISMRKIRRQRKLMRLLTTVINVLFDIAWEQVQEEKANGKN
jgi:hypothetical protein